MNQLNLRKTTFFWNLLILFILHVSTDAQGWAPLCPVFKVQRGTVHKAFRNKPLEMSCNLQYCDGQTVNVTWAKEDNKEWIPVSGADHMISSRKDSSSNPKILISFLTITNISKHHDGIYRCELKSSNFSMVSHHINVSVSDDSMETEKGESTEIDSPESSPWWQKYLFICLAVVILVIVAVLISSLCINGCKCSRKRDRQRAHVQYAATSLSPSVQKHDELVCSQYSEQTRQKNSVRSAPVHSTSHLSSDCDGDDSQSNRTDSRSSQVVYASLHHLTSSPSSSSTPKQTTEECSEYAAIRLS